jgi:hypothetical protein
MKEYISKLKLCIQSAIIFVLISLLSSASADIIRMETNTWEDRRPLTWSGTLLRIDLATQIAHFSYRNGSELQLFSVHVTRIYSLEIDNQNRVNRSFPRTRMVLSEPLPTNLRARTVIELSNENFVGANIPQNVHIRPDRDGQILYLSGTILEATIGDVQLKVRASGENSSTFTIDRSDLLKWIRGQ